jgi:hypothetical protein
MEPFRAMDVIVSKQEHLQQETDVAIQIQYQEQ